MGWQQWSRAEKISVAAVVVTLLGAVITGGVTLFATKLANSQEPPKSTVVVNNTVIPQPPTGLVGPNSPTTRTCPDAPSPSHKAVLSVDLYVRVYQDRGCWTPTLELGTTPSTVQFMLSYTNTGSALQKDVTVRVTLANGLALVPDSTLLASGSNPNGILVPSNAIAQNGFVIGSYQPRANAFVAFEARTPFAPELKCGPNTLRTSVFVQPAGEHYFYNTADISLTRHC